MPGTTVNIGTAPGSTAGRAPRSAQMLIVGLTQRGDPNAVITVTSMAEFTKYAGDPQAYSWAYHAARTFFGDGGEVLRLARVVGPNATAGAVTIGDGHSPAAVPTLTITAADPGPWSALLTVTIRAGVIPNTFDVLLTLGTTLVEQHLSCASPADLSQRLAASTYARGADLGSTSVAPANNPAPGTYQLTAGTDDRTSVTPATMTTALGRFPLELGAGVVAIPGYSALDIAPALKAHCTGNDRTFYCALPQGTTEAAALAAAPALLDQDLGGESGKLLWPWVTYTDAGVTYTVPPEGFAAAGRCNAFRQVGPWQAAAGDYTASTFLTGVEFSVGSTDGNLLDSAHVCAIRIIAGLPTVYGERSLSTDAVNWDLLCYREIVASIGADLRDLVEQFNFKTADAGGRYYARLESEIRGYLAPIAEAGGLYPTVRNGLQIDPGYSVDTSPAVNTASLIASELAAAVVKVTPSPTATGVSITLVKTPIAA